ncbi:uncharacterized protein LOC134224486 [Armigeres subalbatus]|uniref:uncharacterized protein LOC134224486 n=1 Tax=Armigeres subalbatus TaxID=124917 RepID=UPI002ED52560
MDSFTDDDFNEEFHFENIEMLDEDADLSFIEDENGLEEEQIQETTSCLYRCRLLAFVRQFKGQSSGAHIAHWDVQAKSVNDFLRKVWILAKSHLLREVVFHQQEDGSTVPKWSDKEEPEESDFNKFAIFYEKQNRKYTMLDKITTNLLHSWRDKEIHVLLHVYSLSVSSRKIFTTVKQHLIDPSNRDKSGAASTQIVVELSRDLRREHGDRWDAHEIVWTMWASAILSSPAHSQGSMKTSATPLQSKRRRKNPAYQTWIGHRS